MLILVLVLKDSLRTYFKSWSLGVMSLFLSWSLWVRSLSLSWSLWSSFDLVLVFSPCKDLFPLFHYSNLFAYYYIVVSMHTISFNYTCLCLPAAILLCVYKYDVYGLAMFFCYNHRYFKAYNIYGYNTSLVFHLERSNENLK